MEPLKVWILSKDKEVYWLDSYEKAKALAEQKNWWTYSLSKYPTICKIKDFPSFLRNAANAANGITSAYFLINFWGLRPSTSNNQLIELCQMDSFKREIALAKLRKNK